MQAWGWCLALHVTVIRDQGNASSLVLRLIAPRHAQNGFVLSDSSKVCVHVQFTYVHMRFIGPITVSVLW